jgi:hypothetical protein
MRLLSSLMTMGFRILLRLMLSRMHMAIENKNRACLTSIYVSLLDETVSKGSEINDEQRTIILASLFRPSTVGIVKDEGFSLDPSIVAGISKVLTPK